MCVCVCVSVSFAVIVSSVMIVNFFARFYKDCSHCVCMYVYMYIHTYVYVCIYEASR